MRCSCRWAIPAESGSDPSWLSFVSLCQSLASAAVVTSPKPVELQPVVQSASVETFDMANANEDGAWTVPEGELHAINFNIRV